MTFFGWIFFPSKVPKFLQVLFNLIVKHSPLNFYFFGWFALCLSFPHRNISPTHHLSWIIFMFPRRFSPKITFNWIVLFQKNIYRCIPPSVAYFLLVWNPSPLPSENSSLAPYFHLDIILLKVKFFCWMTAGDLPWDGRLYAILKFISNYTWIISTKCPLTVHNSYILKQ